jgi:hypothetical protein
MATSGDINVIKKEQENVLKYKDLRIEIHPTWKLKTNLYQ